MSSSTLKVVISEQIVLNGTDYGSRNEMSITSIDEIAKRIVTITTTETGLLGFATAPSTDLAKSYVAGQFDEDDVRYIRITNLDSTNHVTLTFRSEGAAEFAVKLDHGQTFIYNGDLSTGVVDTMDASASALTVSLEDLVDITAQADTDSCNLEIFVASE